MIKGTCHCGAVSYTYDKVPQRATACNCSICRRLGALWIYATLPRIAVTGATISYSHGDKDIAFHSCATCGCTTHWENLHPEEADAYMAVNLNLAEPEAAQGVRVRRFDGADTWEFLD